MECTVRPMERDDWSEVLEIYYQGIQTNNATFELSCPSYEEWDGKHIKSCRFVAEDDFEVVGWAAVSPVSSRECYKGVAELSIYIDVDHRGKGIGTLLLKKLIEESEKAGFWTLEAGIMQTNAASIRLHEKLGFRTVGYRERIAKDRFGVWRNTVLMERRITKDAEGGCDCDMIKKLRSEQAEKNAL